ncbi:nuclear transport factor 2 family protein [Pedobacter sp. GSP4]|uniref:nuclear transport factor 2 family protein n=1 Tax=Pedobacter sp. GSP4 TaxID=3453716 RepID=UPI003EEEF2C4
MESQYWPIIKKAYDGFNIRNIDGVFAVMHADVKWPKAFEGGYVSGQDAVREYWTRQWSEINPIVEPLSVTERPDGKIAVLVDQLVKDLEGNVIFDGQTIHVYVFKDHLILSMEIGQD